MAYRFVEIKIMFLEMIFLKFNLKFIKQNDYDYYIINKK